MSAGSGAAASPAPPAARGDPAGAAPAVRGRGLAFTHPGGRVALAGVDVEVGARDVLAVLGPNGSGKTTLLRLLATAAPVQAGTLELLGEPAAPSPGLRRRIGFAGDGPVHAGALRARESAELMARSSGLGRAEAAARAAHLLGLVGLGADGDRPVDGFSLGMRRRLLLAEALVHRPDLLLLDEPTLGLDPDGLDRLAALLEQAAAAGVASVLATNDVAFAERAAARVLLLDRGHGVAAGTPAELLARVDARAIVEVDLAAPPARAPAFAAGLEPLGRPDGSVALRVPRGGGVLPGVLRALEEAGASVRAVSVREPDLGDVFRALTGRGLV